MKNTTFTLRSFLITLVLLPAILAACTPVTSTPAPVGAVTEQQVAPPVETAQAAEPPPLAVVTARGDELFATDPSSVQLAAGQLQLVEFFRFT